MKIALVSQSYYPRFGGVTEHVAHTASELRTRGHEVTVVTTAFLHIGVVVGLLPTTGLTLPVMSSGRSNLVLSLFMTGMLVNIGSTKERVHGGAATDPLAAPAW